MRTKQVILADLAAARADYEKGVQTLPAPKVQALAAQVKDLKQELNDWIIEGAKPCADCGNLPIGLIQSANTGKMVFEYYEVGCANCRDHRAQAQTREEAVDAWNQGKFIKK